jgi:26S proteasome regulatory subunit T6
MLELLN